MTKHFCPWQIFLPLWGQLNTPPTNTHTQWHVYSHNTSDLSLLKTTVSVLSLKGGSSGEKPLFKDSLTGGRPCLIPIRLGHFEADASTHALISQQTDTKFMSPFVATFVNTVANACRHSINWTRSTLPLPVFHAAHIRGIDESGVILITGSTD